MRALPRTTDSQKIRPGKRQTGGLDPQTSAQIHAVVICCVQMHSNQLKGNRLLLIHWLGVLPGLFIGP